LFSNSPLSTLSCLSRGPASRLAFTRTISTGLEPDAPPPLGLLSFECLWPPLLKSSFPSDCSENHLILVNSVRTVPLGLLLNPPWVSF
jgi:hypothetical protein